MNYVSSITGSVNTLQTASQIAASTDPATFQAWPEAVKARFVQANGTGSPPAVVVGSGMRATPILATLSADGAGVTTTPLPADFSDLPAELDPDTFSAWSTDLQLFYLRGHLAAGASSLAIGPDDAAIEASLSAAGDAVVVSGGAEIDAAYAARLTDPRYAPGGSASPKDFLTWPQDVQYRYFQAYAGSGGLLDFGTKATAGLPVQLAFNGVSYTALVRPDQLADAKAAGFTTVAGVSADAFAAWPRELQRAYVEAVAEQAAGGGLLYPATVVLGSGQGTVIATVASADADVDALAAPAGFADALKSGTPPSLETFTGWPESAQLAYARAALPSAYRTLQLYSSSPAAGGTPSSLSVARDANSASGITMTPALGSVPQAADLSLLHLLSPGQLQTYLSANGTGTPPAVVLGASPSLFLVTAGTDPSQSGVAIQALPAAAADPAAPIGSSDFLSWTPEVENYVFGRRGIGTPAALLLADGYLATATTAPAAAGYVLERAPAGLTTLATADAGAAATFAGWSAAAQSYYFARNAAGAPPALMLGAAGARTLVSPPADPAASGLLAQAVPADFTQGVASLDAAAFLSWSPEVQSAYLAARGTGTPQGLQLASSTTPGSAVLTVTRDAANPYGVDIDIDVGRGDAPTDADLALLKLLPPAELQGYLVRHGTGTPKSIVVGTNQPILLTASVDPSNAVPSFVDLSAVPSFFDPKTATAAAPKGGLTEPEDLQASTFGRWPAEVQAYYFTQHAAGTPPAVLVGSGSRQSLVTAWTAPTGASPRVQPSLGVVVQPYPAAGLTPAQVTGAAFSSWTPAVQAFYFAQTATGTPPVLVVGPDGTQSVIAADGAGGFTVEAFPSTAPADLTPAAFDGWSSSVQQAYAQRYGQGFLLGFVIGTTDQYLISRPATASQKAFVGVQLAASELVARPAAQRPGYQAGTTYSYLDTPPANLDTSTFVAWSAEKRAYYLATQGSGTPKTVTFGTGFSATATATDPGGDYAIPYYKMYGGPSGTDNTTNTVVSNALFPVYDGVTTKMSQAVTFNGDGTTTAVAPPAGFSTSPDQLDPSVFAMWNSAFQLEYVHRYVDDATAYPPSAAGGAGPVYSVAAYTYTDANGTSQTIPASTYLRIGGPNAATNPNTYNDVFVGGPKSAAGFGTVVYTAQNLQKQDIAKMSLADQVTLSGVASFNTAVTGLAAGLGLIPDGTAAVYGAATTDPTSALGRMQRQVLEAEARILYPTTDLSGTNGAASVTVDGMTYSIADPNAPIALKNDGAMPASDKKVFIDQLKNIGKELLNSAIFSPNDVNQKITAILTRFTRANDFAVNALSNHMTYALSSIVGTEVNAKGEEVKAGEAIDASNGDFFSYWGSAASIMQKIQGLRAFGTYQGTGGASVSIDGSNGGGQLVSYDQNGNIKFSVQGLEIDHRDGDGKIDNTLFISSAKFGYQQLYGSLDQDQSIKQSYTLFMNQERQLLQLQNAGLSLASADKDGKYHDANGNVITKNLDLPNLIYLFQLYANLSGEATIRADTEEVNQVNNLLKLYGIMQQIVNQTVSGFSADDNKNNNAHTIAKAPDAATQAQWDAAIAFFSTTNNMGTTDVGTNPIELIKGISRPRENYGGNYSSNQWQGFGTQLSDTVTLLNQDSQLKMNDINTETKQKDRNFDLANSALSKMYDNLQKILGAS